LSAKDTANESNDTELDDWSDMSSNDNSGESNSNNDDSTATEDLILSVEIGNGTEVIEDTIKGKISKPKSLAKNSISTELGFN